MAVRKSFRKNKTLFKTEKKVKIVSWFYASWILTKRWKKMFISRIRIVRKRIIKDNNGSSLWTIKFIFNLVKPFYSLLSLHFRCGCVLLGFIQEYKFNPLQGWFLCGLRVESTQQQQCEQWWCPINHKNKVPLFESRSICGITSMQKK